MSAYEELKFLTTKVTELRQNINNCQHKWVDSTPMSVVVTVAVDRPHDPRDMPGMVPPLTEQVYGMRYRRECSVCGLSQVADKTKPAEDTKWRDT